MYNHLISFIDKEDILCKSQFGFRKSHSTNNAIISLVEKVIQALDSGKVLVRIFLDLKIKHLIQLITKFYVVSYLLI